MAEIEVEDYSLDPTVYPFSGKYTVSPYLYIDLYGIEGSKPWFVVPNKNLLGFEINFNPQSGMTGRIELFDDYDNLDPFTRGHSDIESFLLSMIANVRKIGIKFGWNIGSGGTVLSPYYPATVMKFSYQISETGLKSTIDFATSGLDDRFFIGMFDAKEKEISGQPIDIIKHILEKYNEGAGDEKFKINPKVGDGLYFYNCPEILNRDMEGVDEFSLAGKTFRGAIAELLEKYCVPKKIDHDKYIYKYNFFVQTVEGKKQLVIYKDVFITTEKKVTDENGKEVTIKETALIGSTKIVIKRRFYYRAGGKSNVLSYSYDDSPFFALLTQAFTCNIEAVGFDPDKNELAKIEKPKTSGCPSESLRKMWDIQNLGSWEKRVKKEGDEAKLKNLVTVDMSRIGWDSTKAGRALLRNVYHDVAVMACPKVEITIPGDPLFVVGYSNVTGKGGSKESKEIKYVGMNDVVSLWIYNTAGQRVDLLSGLFRVTGFSHSISEGNFTTKVQLVRDMTAVTQQTKK